MAIDTAEDRRAIAGLSLAHFYGPGVTPNNDKDAEWRSEVGYGYPNVPFAPEYTDTQDIQLPVDCALAGKQLIKDGYREFDIRPMDEVNATVASTTHGKLFVLVCEPFRAWRSVRLDDPVE